MKYIVTFILFVAVTVSISAQTPEKISYQAIIRATDNSLVVNSNVSIKIIIHQGTITGTTVYQETHNATTNAGGLVSLIIGNGSSLIGNFSQINWAQSSYFIETQVDVTGGTNYNVIGASQLLSVPYALHAKTATSITGPNPYKAAIISFTASRNLASSDINNTVACTSTATLTLPYGFSSMAIGDTINLEAHNGATLTVKAETGVTLNYTNGSSAQYVSTTGTVRFGLLRKTGTNAYIISGQ
ncbi:hypothetical protein EV196_10399 [Mariniflexile fucanivorans]|uniref:Uncharacterized protein n=1 Tax=Mariniflexile fucanivorans TaxID=264023 RepID=A0A4R1RKT6_9FLAO|nr:hypothetical protein [Mariniflexile fucanivorans]TCL66686.1 hypothetical protein EV196_10399 [Mariniflexile fucanivorans]